MTLLEVVVSIVMLAGVTATVLAAISHMEGVARKHKHELNAVEVAHRIIAQKLDKSDLLPPENLPIQQGDSLYYYKLFDEVIVIGETESGNAEFDSIRSDDADVNEQIKNRLHQVIVHVFPADEMGRQTSVEPIVTVVRFYDILKGDDDEVLKRILDIIDQGSGRGRSNNRS